MSDRIDAMLGQWRAAIDAQLTSLTGAHEDLPSRLRDAIHYSVTGEGKRLRGLLLMASYDALRGSPGSPRGDASGLAAAVEIVHAYSLVHDDLPCMDDDSMRRGRATTHRAFDVATATVAGVAMVPLAVSQTLRAARRLGLGEGPAKTLVAVLMDASGASGMVGGQLMDLAGEGSALSVTELEAVHRAKTGALIAASMTIGGVAAGGAEPVVRALGTAGAALGLAFQIADDVLDATESSEALGKTAGRDAVLAKSTYASTLGVAAAQSRRDALVADAMARLRVAGLQTPALERLAHFVAARRS